VESLNPISLFLLFLLACLLPAWFLWVRIRSLLEGAREPQSLLLMQQQIDQLRMQLSQTLDNNTQLVQQQLGQMLGQVNDRLKDNAEILQKTQQSLGERLDHAARVVGNVQQSLGGLEEANRKLYEVGKDIASLQEVLRAPKLRGGLGEFFLEDLLAQILPARHFTTQHAFRSGERVDALIKLGIARVPVDAKFPLENFKRMLEAATDEDRARTKRLFLNDVRKHIDAIAGKYILPDEGTYDFALMYIPAENVYYETILKDDAEGEKSLSHYALSRRVIPVSPNSFYAYLQVIVLGLKGMRVEEGAKEIVQYLSRLQGDFLRFRDDFGVLGRHLGHAHASYQNTDKRLEQFGERLLSVDADERLFERSQDGKTS
jgi:DNA recombination protein RmuC